MSRLCSNCHFLGKGKYDSINNYFLANIYLGAITIAIGLTNIAEKSDSKMVEVFLHVFGYSLIIFGVYNILNYFYGGKTCPKCDHTPMLPLDNPEAINLIKKYDLTPGENPFPNTQNEPSPDSLETHK